MNILDARMVLFVFCHQCKYEKKLCSEHAITVLVTRSALQSDLYDGISHKHSFSRGNEEYVGPPYFF